MFFRSTLLVCFILISFFIIYCLTNKQTVRQQTHKIRHRSSIKPFDNISQSSGGGNNIKENYKIGSRVESCCGNL
jgi:cell division protein FtsL